MLKHDNLLRPKISSARRRLPNQRSLAQGVKRDDADRRKSPGVAGAARASTHQSISKKPGSSSRRWHRCPATIDPFPRHTINLVSVLVVGYFLLEMWHCSEQMTQLVQLAIVTGIVFHGTHCLGYENFADKYFMLPDFLAVIACASYCMYIAEKVRLNLVLVNGGCFLIWILTFSLLRGSTCNITQTILHIFCCIINSYAASSVCEVLRPQ